ncbi:MAG: hypothetical protein IK085_05960, partial [Clostridia bacterium]|nr:hypothetical protein [Clostridia bacterium]
MHFNKSAKTKYHGIKVIVIISIMMTLAVILSGCKNTDSKNVVTLNTISNTSENYEIHCSREDNLKSHPVLSSGLLNYLSTQKTVRSQYSTKAILMRITIFTGVHFPCCLKANTQTKKQKMQALSALKFWAE